MSMIEQVARASHAFFQPIYKLPPWEQIPPDAQSLALQHAKACIAAMREPPESMKKFDTPSGDVINFDAMCHYCGGHKFAWESMIDAAVAGQ